MHCWQLLEVVKPFRLEQVVQELGLSTGLLLQNFTAVLAIGSNGSPEQLARKFQQSRFPGRVLIPVVRAVLEDFDVVYAPLIAAYGSCPGNNLIPSSPELHVGVHTSIWVWALAKLPESI